MCILSSLTLTLPPAVSDLPHIYSLHPSLLVSYIHSVVTLSPLAIKQYGTSVSPCIVSHEGQYSVGLVAYVIAQIHHH